MKFQKQNRAELLAVVQRQQAEIESLRDRIQALEAADIGKLRREVDELQSWKVEAEKQLRELQIACGMTQGLTFFVGAGVLALLGERFVEVFKNYPKGLSDEKVDEVREKMGELGANLIDTIHKIDGLSRVAWDKQRAILERRAATLPPLKRALFKALSQLAQPSKVGTQLLNVLSQSIDFAKKVQENDQEKLAFVALMLDTASNLWPLASVNSLAPMLKYVGWDDAAEAAGEILDCLERGDQIPRHLIITAQGWAKG